MTAVIVATGLVKRYGTGEQAVRAPPSSTASTCARTRRRSASGSA